MINKILNTLSYVQKMGLNWIFFRIFYEFKKKINYFSWKNKKIIKESSEEKYIRITSIFPNLDPPLESLSVERSENSSKGLFWCFSHDYYNYNQNGITHWSYQPLTKKEAPLHLEWQNIPSFGEWGDIKLIWEPSRFNHVFDDMSAYHQTHDPKFAHICIQKIINWCEQNPFPLGPQWMCGQEMSIRTFHWLVALDYFKDFITSEQETIITKNLYLSGLRIESHIDFARKSIRNNHSISECMGLIILGLSLKSNHSQSWIKNGINYLSQELSYQVFSDGSYIQHSFNYQRYALDVVSLIIYLLEIHQISIPQMILEKHSLMIDFLSSFIQEKGQVPNYGANDGALLFQLGKSNYYDYRPSLEFASRVNKKQSLYPESDIICRFFKIPDYSLKNREEFLNKEFFQGGYFILKNKNIFIFSRAHHYKTRPGHCDPNHVDIWVDGKNLLSDSGTYSYNINSSIPEDLSGMLGHNVLQIENQAPMEKVGRFGSKDWLNSKGKIIQPNQIFMENKSYFKKFGITLKREIVLFDKSFVVKDSICGLNKKLNFQQVWNSPYEFEPNHSNDLNRWNVKNLSIKSSLENCVSKIETTHRSTHYQKLDPGFRLTFSGVIDRDCTIETFFEIK